MTNLDNIPSHMVGYPKGGDAMAYSEAAKNATLRYREKKGLVKINIDTTPEKRDLYKAQAAKHNMSLAAYIDALITADMQRDTPEG